MKSSAWKRSHYFWYCLVGATKQRQQEKTVCNPKNFVIVITARGFLFPFWEYTEFTVGGDMRS